MNNKEDEKGLCGNTVPCSREEMEKARKVELIIKISDYGKDLQGSVGFGRCFNSKEEDEVLTRRIEEIRLQLGKKPWNRKK